MAKKPSKKELEKQARLEAKGKEQPPVPRQTIQITSKEVAQILSEIEEALSVMQENAEFELVLEGNALLDETLALRLPPGLTLHWQANLQGKTTLFLEGDGEKEGKKPPICIIEEPGYIENTALDGPAISAKKGTAGGLDLVIQSGVVSSIHGPAIKTDGSLKLLGGQVKAYGDVAVTASAIEPQSGLVYTHVSSSKESEPKRFISPFVAKDWEAGTCIALAWTGETTYGNGYEQDLNCFPKEAGAWWEVNAGQVSICYGRGDNFGSIPVGSIELPAPLTMSGVTDDSVHIIPVPFKAKTGSGERVTTLDIEWGWDLFLRPSGSKEYDNRIAIAACVLCNAAYSPEDILQLMQILGFEETYLGNSGILNATSAYILGYHYIADAKKTLFAVVNRGSQTLTDWKGNIVSETVQQAGYFTQSAKEVAEKLMPYVRKYGNEDPNDNLFLVTGHSLGGVVTDILAAQELNAYPGKNVFAYTFAAPLAEDSVKEPKDRPIYNIINQKDVVTSIPPRLSYHRLGSDNYGFVPTAKSSPEMADRFRFLSHMDMDKLEEMNGGIKGFFKGPIAAIMWNHSLTTYLAYLLAGGPGEIKREGSFLWNLLQNR